MAATMSMDRQYHFTHQAADECLDFVDKTTKENLIKWGMFGGMRYYRWTYSNKFELYKADTFFSDLLASDEAQRHIQVLPSSGSSRVFRSLAAVTSRKAPKVSVAELRTIVTDLSFFERIKETGLASESGRFKQPGLYDRMPDDPDEADLVRLMLMKHPQEDESRTFSAGERSEFIFKIFSHLVLGGVICQYDDALEPYTSATSALYGKLVTPYRDTQAGGTGQRIVLKACTYNLLVQDDDAGELVMPGCQAHGDSAGQAGAGSTSSPGFTYAIVEPLKKQVAILSYDPRAGSTVMPSV